MSIDKQIRRYAGAPATGEYDLDNPAQDSPLGQIETASKVLGLLSDRHALRQMANELGIDAGGKFSALDSTFRSPRLSGFEGNPRRAGSEFLASDESYEALLERTHLCSLKVSRLRLVALEVYKILHKSHLPFFMT